MALNLSLLKLLLGPLLQASQYFFKLKSVDYEYSTAIIFKKHLCQTYTEN